jgi:hypothetical protein
LKDFHLDNIQKFISNIISNILKMLKIQKTVAKAFSFKALALCLPLAFSITSCDKAGTGSKIDSTKIAQDKPKVEEKIIPIDQKATTLAAMISGLPVEDTTGFGNVAKMAVVKQQVDFLNKGWEGLDAKYLAPMRKWRDAEISDMNKEGNTLFYPFSGPDFLNAYNIFPNCDNFLMFGLEGVGHMPTDFGKKNEQYITAYMGDIRNALESVMSRNYFITSYMGSNLYRRSQGVAPIISVFMARTGNKVISINKVFLDKDGKPSLKPLDDKKENVEVYGLAIQFINKDRKKPQTLYYFGTNVIDAQMKKKQNLVNFIRSFPNKVGYIKSASYILFDTNFLTIKNLVMEETSAVLQDDTGVRFKDYMDSGKWKVQLYGGYARPVIDFQSYTYQPELAAAFKKDSLVKKLGFPYGYHWKEVQKVSVLVARRK